jgi:hypothetical protein
MDAIPYNICTQPIIPTFQYNPKRQPSVFEAIGDFFSAGERSRGASTRSGTIQGNVFVDSRSADAKEPSLGQHVALAPNSSSLDSASTSDLAIASSGSVIAPRGSGMSDHEYAFRLQQQYDAEYLRR